MLSGRGSGLPGEDIDRDTIGDIICNGDEDSLTECMAQEDPYEGTSRFFGENSGDNSVAIICSDPSGRNPHSLCMYSTTMKCGSKTTLQRL